MPISRKWLLFLSAVIIIVFWIYIKGNNAPPLFDDIEQINHVRNMSSFSDCWKADCYNLFRPVKNLLFYWYVKLPQSSVSASLLTPLIVHIINIVLLTIYIQSITKRKEIAYLTSALWALAPTQVSSIAWASCVNIQIMIAGILGALLLHEYARKCNCLIIAGLSILSFIVALLSYEGAVVLTGLLFLRDYAFDRNRLRQKSTWLYYGAYFVITLGYVAFHSWFMKGVTITNEQIAPMQAWELSLSSAFLTVKHLMLWIWPFGEQSILTTFDIHTVGLVRICSAWTIIAVLLAIMIKLQRKHVAISFGIAWFLVSIFPLSNIIPLFNGPFADYYLPLPSIGLALITAYSLSNIFDAWKTSQESTHKHLFLLLLISISLWRAAGVLEMPLWVRSWKSELLLLERSLKAEPDSYAVKVSLARLLSAGGEHQRAEGMARETIVKAPWHSQTYYVLADSLWRQGKYNDAIDIYASIAEKRSFDPTPLVLTGQLQAKYIKDEDSARESYRKALKRPWRSPYSTTAAKNLANSFNKSGNREEAIVILNKAIAIAPNEARLHQTLAITYYQSGTFDKALHHASIAENLGMPIDKATLALFKKGKSTKSQ